MYRIELVLIIGVAVLGAVILTKGLKQLEAYENNNQLEEVTEWLGSQK